MRDGDEWVINGQKIYTRSPSYADYVWLACRTDPDAPEAQGHLDLHRAHRRDPGFRYTPISTIMGGGRTNATYYDDVRVPDRHVVGEVNRGWDLITNQLNHERVAPRARRRMVAPATTTCSPGPQDDELADGRRVIDQEWVQVNLARVRARLEYLTLLNWKVAWPATEGDTSTPPTRRRSRCSAPSSSLEAYRLLMEIIGPDAAPARRSSPAPSSRAGSSRRYQGTLILTFGGGINEIQRDLIAMFGLGFPRAKR